MKRIIFASIFLIVFVLCIALYAGESENAIGFNSEDRVLILSPHPDDEAIGTAGVIQRALKQNAKIRVVCYTNGDSNQLAFIVYEKRLTFKKAEFLHMGEVRRRETMRAMVSLGINPEDIIFLGYPDFGTLEIFTKYWGDTVPYKSLFTKVSRVSYREAMSFNAPYQGESILNDLEKIILDFKPTRIFVSHSADTNRDHKSLYLFLRVALWDLEGRINSPVVLPYVIHVVHWPMPRGYHPGIELKIPDSLAGNNIELKELMLTEEEVKKKHDAISFYKSEIEYNPKYLFTFARKNELFWDFPVIRLNSLNSGEILWQGLDSNLSVEIDPEHKKEAEKNIKPDISYAARDGKLCVRMRLKKKIEKDLGVSVFLFGYNREKKFGDMPKLYIKIDTLGVHVRDKKQLLQVKDVELEFQDRTLILKVPFNLLGNPDRILTCAMTHPNDFPLDETSWRTIYLQ